MSEAVIRGLIEEIAPQLDMVGLLTAREYLDEEDIEVGLLEDMIREREDEMERELVR